MNRNNSLFQEILRARKKTDLGDVAGGRQGQHWFPTDALTHDLRRSGPDHSLCRHRCCRSDLREVYQALVLSGGSWRPHPLFKGCWQNLLLMEQLPSVSLIKPIPAPRSPCKPWAMVPSSILKVPPPHLWPTLLPTSHLQVHLVTLAHLADTGWLPGYLYDLSYHCDLSYLCDLLPCSTPQCQVEASAG